MAENKFNLDFNVWGTTSPQKVENEAAPLKTIGKGWSSASRPVTAEPDATYVAPPTEKDLKKFTCTLKKAYFIPDSNTGFNKPCTIKVELEGEPKGPLTIALWAIYKDTDHNLQHVRTVNAKNGTAEDMLTLYYVDQHFDDLHGRGETDAKANYYAKITCKGAREILSDLLEMPHSNKIAEIYKRSDYDDTVLTDEKHPKSGPCYKTGSGIKDLQQILITAGFLDIKTPNGSYGPKTEEAVIAFQKCALGKQRKQKDKMIEVAITFSGKDDGIAEEKTLQELNLWKKEGYQKPAPAKLSGSVGVKSDNKADDVKLVKDRLKELGYPIPEVNETCCADTIKSIKFFQTLSWGCAIGSVALPDGQISKGKSTEKTLFSDTAPKYSAPVKGSVKVIQNDEQTKLNNATGNDKIIWDKIKEVWDEVSPYLPAGSKMTSGYRTAQEQREILYKMYNTDYKTILKNYYGDDVYDKYKNLQNKSDAAAEKEMCNMLKKAANQDIAAPGNSKHNSGKAIDIGGTGDDKQVEILRWYSVEFADKKHVAKIIKEKNGCVHFEFL